MEPWGASTCMRKDNGGAPTEEMEKKGLER